MLVGLLMLLLLLGLSVLMWLRNNRGVVNYTTSLGGDIIVDVGGTAVLGRVLLSGSWSGSDMMLILLLVLSL